MPLSQRYYSAFIGFVFAGAVTLISRPNGVHAAPAKQSEAPALSAPAGTRPAAENATIDGYDAAVLPSGRIITPAGIEVSVGAPKPYGLALSPDGRWLITSNDGTSPFSATLIRDPGGPAPVPLLIKLDAAFMGVAFSKDSSRFFVSGGEDGVIWVGDTASGAITALVNLNTPAHPLAGPIDPAKSNKGFFKGAFPGNLALSQNGKLLYVVDQAGFRLHIVDVTKIDSVSHGLLAADPNNFSAVTASLTVGRYPFSVAVTPDDRTVLVANVGIFQYSHLTPTEPNGDPNHDYPISFPAAGYPDLSRDTRTVQIKKVDPANLVPTLSDPSGAILSGYIPADTAYTVPGLGDPNAPESSSLYVFTYNKDATRPVLRQIVKTGLQVGEAEFGIPAFGGSHPNSVAIGTNAIYVANGNNDTISILDRKSYRELGRVDLRVLEGFDARLKGVQPVYLAISPDGTRLYVAESGINAVGVLSVTGKSATLLGHIPVGWWPSAIQVSADNQKLYVANARGRGAPANNGNGSPKSSTIGSVSILSVPSDSELSSDTQRVLLNNGFVPGSVPGNAIPIPNQFGKPSKQIRHVIFINKENSTYDQLLGDIVVTAKGVPANGNPAYSLGEAASPNHHSLALTFAFSDNFFLEPSVSSDGHRWLTNNPPTEFEDTHWPASYGGRRRDAGDDPNVYIAYPGRLGFTDANSSPTAEDYPQRGTIYEHLGRYGVSFVNFGNGFEFAEVDEDGGTEPTGIRNHVNVPMSEVLREHTDQLFPEFNTHIPDAPLPENPSRFNRFGRFKQVFESQYVDRNTNACRLPAYVDLYYPNDHGGGANDINPQGPPWSFTRFVQDNDAALGQTVDLISHSPCWNDTVIFVVEDDTQNGLDHVNGFRSILLAISPWVKHQYLGKLHYSLASVFKTVELILGVPPLNQYDASATDLRDLFAAQPDYTPYSAAQIVYAKGVSRQWVELTRNLRLTRPDANELELREAILRSEGLPRPERPKDRHVGLLTRP